MNRERSGPPATWPRSFAFLLVDHYLAEPLPMQTPKAVLEFEKVG